MRMMLCRAAAAPLAAATLLTGCTPTVRNATPVDVNRLADAMDRWPDPATVAVAMGNAFVRLTLEAGSYEEGYIDAYYGPAEAQQEAVAERRSRDELITEAQAMVVALDRQLGRPAFATDVDTSPHSPRRRLLALRGMLVAAATRLRMVGGERLRFADEADGLFSTVPTLQPLSHYDAILARLERTIPGTGPLSTRVDAFNERYTIPADRLRIVFDAAIAECRRRTMAHIALPQGESFTLEFVTNKPWSGYNYYQGGYRSLIQVNTDLPIRISRAVDLGCHEGYPGHHVLNLLAEQRLVNQRGWREYSVYPLYSPQSVLAEGSANYGIDLAFPGPERLAFERDILYPLAGLDPATAEAYWQLQQATEALTGARLTIAQMYLDGDIDRARAVELTQHYLLVSPARAEQSVGFTETYRSYVINYGWGKQLVRDFIERGNADAATRWARMEALLGEPTRPADLTP